MKMIYPAVFYPYSDGSGGYVVEFPDLPGCVTGGKNLQEAIEMAMNAFSSDATTHKGLILITDSEDHIGEAVEMATNADKQNIQVNI